VGKGHGSSDTEGEAKLAADAAEWVKVEGGYKQLFDSIPVGIIEQDYSSVKGFLDDLRAKGVEDFREHFTRYPEELVECVSKIRVVDVNRTAVSIMRAESGAQLAHAVTQQFKSGPIERMFEVVDAVAVGQRQRAREVQTIAFDGTPLTLSVSTVVVRGFEETYGRMLTSMTDITPLRDTERALAESEARFKAMADASPAGIYFYDREARVHYVNPAGVALVGLSGEEIVGLGWERAIHPDDLDRLRQEIGAALSEGRGFDGTGRFLHSDGRVVWWEAQAARVALPDGAERFVSVVLDVSERVESERILRENQALLRGVMQSSPSAITVKNLSGEFLFANETAAAGLGIPSDQIPGLTLQDVLPPDAASDAARKDREVLRSGSPLRTDEVYFRDGRRYVVDVLRFPVIGESGEPVALCVTATDVTDRLNLEQVKRQQRKQLAEDIHDDSVQVMASIALQLETLARRGDIGSESTELLAAQAEAVRVATRRLRDLMSDLATEDSDEGVLEGLGRLAELIKKDHSIEVEVRCPHVFGMPMRLESLLLRNAREALVNIVKHSGASSVQIELSMQQGGVELSISDDGGGFDPSTEPARGHLGIPSMRERTESVGGRFSISSTPGSGTSVRFWLPTGPGTPVSHSTAAG
jgi:PAS domain S-box-containing protein